MGAARTAIKVTSAAVDTVRRPRAGPGGAHLPPGRAAHAVEVDLPLALFAEQMAELAARPSVVTLDRRSRAPGRRVRAARRRWSRSPSTTAPPTSPTLALPVLVEHRVPATLYVATDFVERGRDVPRRRRAALVDRAARRVATGLVDVGSHTHTHALLDRLPADEIDDELDRSIELIGEHLGVRAGALRLPEGGDGLAGRRRRGARPVRLRRRSPAPG